MAELNARDIEKQRKALKVSFENYEESIKETIEHMKNALDEQGLKRWTQDDIDAQVALITAAQNDVAEKYVFLGGSMDDLKKKKRKKAVLNNSSNVLELLNEMEKDKKEEEPILRTETAPTETILTDNSSEFTAKKEEMSSKDPFDIISLPSNGECYKDKTGKVSVSYLNAWDEDIIIAPNLYRDNSVIDILLSRKIKGNINPDNLIEGDRDAIILFLRANGYGVEYPITATDEKTGIEFDAVADLSKLKYKPFTLKGDENGWFDYKLPVSGDEVKFKFLTHKDIMNLSKLEEIENKKIERTKLDEIIANLDTFIEADDKTALKDKIKVRQSIREIEKWKNTLPEEDAQYTHAISNRLELSIMSINGNQDRTFIHDYIKNMRAKDSSSLRKYILENEPGVDYNLRVEKPESLGGGSMEVFLQLDKFLFLNLPE